MTYFTHSKGGSDSLKERKVRGQRDSKGKAEKHRTKTLMLPRVGMDHLHERPATCVLSVPTCQSRGGPFPAVLWNLLASVVIGSPVPGPSNLREGARSTHRWRGSYHFETYQEIGNSYVPSTLDVNDTRLDTDSVQCWAPRESRKRDRTPSQPQAVSVRCSSNDRWL